MKEDKLHFIRIANNLNNELHETLVKRKLHFRGNFKSFSIISVSQETPEIGKSGLKTEKDALRVLDSLKLKAPERKTEEKNLQAFMINYAINNSGKLPIEDLTYLTSELAFVYNDNKRIVNDLLAIDRDNNLVIIELKSLRDNKVKQQTIDFEEKAVLHNKELFSEIIKEISGLEWNGKIRKLAVWPKLNNTPRVDKSERYHDVELYNYTFKPEQVNKDKVVMESVNFNKE